MTAGRGGRVSLVGAGPGDPGLLTVRAAELLAEAEVLAHDALIAPAILARAHPRALRVPVGHRAHDGAAIYRLHPAVLEHARAGRHVVRLKQGDPLLFGRGGEEAEELAAAGIPFEIVPGVTAALGACAAAGIPLTHRDLASEVVLASGHPGRRPGGDRDPTLVLYMATRSLPARLDALRAAGRPAHTPAALIYAGTTPEQRVITGTLADLAERAPPPAAGGPPGLVVVGDVVGVRERLGRGGRR